MSKRDSVNNSDSPVDEELTESLSAPADEGISLEQLGHAYANLVDVGDDPYDPTPSDESDSEAPAQIDIASEEDDPDACCPVSPASIVEALLFVGHPENEPISSRNIASLMRGVRSNEVEMLVQELNELYAESGCPYHIETLAAGYRMSLTDSFASVRENFYGRVREAKLNQAAIEALATVAYNQPLSRADLKERCDPVQCRAVTQLVRRGLVSAEKEGEKASSTVYRTTNRFLQMFGLTSLKDLPQPHDLDQS